MVLGGNGLSLWGVSPGSPLRYDALDFLQIKALGAPATLLLMVAQVTTCVAVQSSGVIKVFCMLILGTIICCQAANVTSTCLGMFSGRV